jgi:thiamine phosphate synthase YjbQ (UPF0047 family)
MVKTTNQINIGVRILGFVGSIVIPVDDFRWMMMGMWKQIWLCETASAG